MQPGCVARSFLCFAPFFEHGRGHALEFIDLLLHGFQLFEQLEGKFAFQAKLVTLMTGLTGFYMLGYMGAWDRYQQVQFWWIHLMTLIWFIFTIVLFVLEPLFLHRRFNQMATENSDKAFSLLHRMHKILLALSLVTVFVTVAGVHGLALI